MSKVKFTPYANEEDSIQISNFTIENRIDRISIYGSLDLTMDKEGLKKAKILKQVVDSTVAVLEKSELPEKIVISKAETVKNPFV